MKKIVLLIRRWATLVILIGGLLGCDSNKKKSPEQHLKNGKKIKIDMSLDSVCLIMGAPDTLFLPGKNDIEKRTVLCYDINDLSYGPGQVYFDSTMKVKDIYFPK